MCIVHILWDGCVDGGAVSKACAFDSRDPGFDDLCHYFEFHQLAESDHYYLQYRILPMVNYS